MNGIRYWECKNDERQAGAFTGEAAAGPAAAKPTVPQKGRGKGAGRSAWKGPGTLWIAEAEAPLRKS